MGNEKRGEETGPSRVAFYTRISTDEDHQKYSLDAQKDRLEAYCKSQYDDDWRLFKIYRDTESGTHMNRPGLEEMLYDASNKAFDVLLVFRVDRLSRKVRELALMVDELTKYHIALKSITEPFDTANAAGKMMLQMLGVFAEFEHATIVERTKVGMEKKAKGGDFVGGYVPFGYRLEPEKGLVVREEEALLVRKIFQMYALGLEGTQTVVNKLNASGIRKRSGQKWEKHGLLQILRNPLYVGKLRWRECIYDGKHDPIISEDIFKKAQEILKERATEVNGRQWHNGEERLLSGVIMCGKCGTHMVGVSTQKKDRKFPYYLCNKRWKTHDCDQAYVRADLLEKAVMMDITGMFQDEQFMARIWAEANRRLGAEKPDVERELGRVEAQMDRTQKSLDRYFQAFEAGSMKPALCNEKVAGLTARLAELDAERAALNARRQRLSLPALDRDMLAKWLKEFEEVFAAGTNPQRKHLLQRVVKKVLIHDRRTVEVWYGLPNSPSVRTTGGLAPRTQPS